MTAISDEARLSGADLPPVDPSIPPWPGRRVTVGGTELFVRTTPGPGTEPALYVHGLGGASTNWTDYAALLATRGIVPDAGSISGRVARAAGGGTGALWRTLRLPGGPPVDLALVRGIGEECTLRDDRARLELGYEGHVTREQGLAELRSEYTPAAASPPDPHRGE